MTSMQLKSITDILEDIKIATEANVKYMQELSETVEKQKREFDLYSNNCKANKTDKKKLTKTMTKIVSENEQL